jgi:hypothetical protein
VEKTRSESLSSQVNLSRILEGNVATLNAVKSIRQANEIWRQFAWIPPQSGTQPFTDLCADCAAIDAIDMSTVWILARHEGPFVAVYARPNKVGRANLFWLITLVLAAAMPAKFCRFLLRTQ